MADIIQKVRTKFVKKASQTLVKQLLDDLLDVGVLNDGQKDSILEDNSNTGDKARALIDIVRKKGDTASWSFITSLLENDPELHNELVLPTAPPAEPAAEPQRQQDGSMISSPLKNDPDLGLPTAPPAEPAAEPQRQQDGSNTNDTDIYPVSKNSIKNRVALLITNIKFANEKMNRNGAEKDEENTEKMLKTLGYEVVKHTNLTGKAIDKAVIEFSKHPKLKETDSVLVVIMSHGKLGAILGVDWKEEISGDEKPDEFPVNNIFKHLGAEQCPALVDKPKIIIIQACRGEKDGAVFYKDGVCPDVESDGPFLSAENIEADGWKIAHGEKDFGLLLSCTPDTVSYRHTDHGSLLIQFVVEEFTFARKDDIEELFRKVMRRFEQLPLNNKRQMASKDRCTLTRRFYFFRDI